MIIQEKYIKELLSKFHINDVKPIRTAIGTNFKLDINQSGPKLNETMYRGIIKALLYLIASKPDIVFSIGICTRFQACPKESHLKKAKRILRYPKGTGYLVLHYLSGGSFDQTSYADADYTRYLVDWKSTPGIIHLRGSSLNSWESKNQNFMALSIVEAKYIIVALYYAQLLWINQQIKDSGIVMNSITLLCNNTTALNMAKI